jgi:hypothetical protein
MRPTFDNQVDVDMTLHRHARGIDKVLKVTDTKHESRISQREGRFKAGWVTTIDTQVHIDIAFRGHACHVGKVTDATTEGKHEYRLHGETDTEIRSTRQPGRRRGSSFVDNPVLLVRRQNVRIATTI